MADSPENWSIEPLSAAHQREAFFCGEPSLDDFLKRFASQNERLGVCRTFIAVRPGERVVAGYYSLSARAIDFESLPEDARKRLPRYPVPVAHLGRLAVDQAAQGQKLGEFLLIDALRRAISAAGVLGIHAVEVVAINDAAAQFYRRYGFVQFEGEPRRLFISLKTVRNLGLI